MKLSKLRKLINQIPVDRDNDEVILQKDAEGNGYSPLYRLDEDAAYVPDTTWSGIVYPIEGMSAEDNGFTEKEWGEIKRDNKCIVLAPTN